MPKIKPTAVSAAVDTVRRNIESRCANFDCRTDEKIAKKLNMPKSTYADRRKNPRNWTLEQDCKARRTERALPEMRKRYKLPLLLQ